MRIVRHKASNSICGKDCGFTQYCTTVHIASKRILWNMMPSKKEDHHYDDYIISLYFQGVMMPNECLGKKCLSTLSEDKYYGTNLV